jgi:hypothetical protein
MEAVLTREFVWDELMLPPLVVPPRRLRRFLLAIDDSAESRKGLGARGDRRRRVGWRGMTGAVPRADGQSFAHS